MYQRFAAEQIPQARLDTPVILLAGARQVGKSTLARAATVTGPGQPIHIDAAAARDDSLRSGRYVTLDDATLRAAAAADSEDFIERYTDPDWMVIDEIQRVPDLLIAIKRSVDADRRPGRFLLTGSANVMAIPTIAESLAGRLEVIPIWPLAQAEIEGNSSAFLAQAFSNIYPTLRTSETAEQIVARALRGGYPEALRRPRPERRDACLAATLRRSFNAR